jgi:hypothetical protein
VYCVRWDLALSGILGARPPREPFPRPLRQADPGGYRRARAEAGDHQFRLQFRAWRSPSNLDCIGPGAAQSRKLPPPASRPGRNSRGEAAKLSTEAAFLSRTSSRPRFLTACLARFSHSDTRAHDARPWFYQRLQSYVGYPGGCLIRARHASRVEDGPTNVAGLPTGRASPCRS